ncbi:MAG: ester cyclase [Desulfobacterales bacterium]|nr:ester cyclase [Desulfobacterales bacterium]
MSAFERQSLERLVARWMAEGWQKGNPSIVDELHANDFVDHASAGRAADRSGFKQGIIELYAAFPDFHAVIDDHVIDLEARKVAVRWRGSGTHRGPFLGQPPTGRTIRFKGIEILYFRQDRIIARWGEWDGLDIFAQISGSLP